MALNPKRIGTDTPLPLSIPPPEALFNRLQKHFKVSPYALSVQISFQ
jgi:hypothetical protein